MQFFTIFPSPLIMETLHIFLYFTLFCFLLLIYKRSNSEKSKRTLKLPPGPRKLPLIGNLHQFTGSLPHHSLRNLANKYGPLMHLQLGEISNVVVTSPEIAKQLFTTHDLIVSNRPHLFGPDIILYGSTDIAFSQYGNHWRQLKKICTLELLTVKRVRSYRRIREEEVSEFVRDIRSHEGSVINMSEKIFKASISIIARAAFGGNVSMDEKAFISSMKELMKMVGGFSIVDLFPSVKVLQVITGMKAKLERIHKLNDEIIDNIFRDHKERKAAGNNENYEENLLDVLIRIQQGEDLEHPFTPDHIKAVILDMFLAGSETSSTTLDWAMSELMKNPRIMEKAQDEVRKVYKEKGYVDESDIHQLKYLNSIVKETLRLHPPGVLLFPRENTERCVINGYEIPEKTKIMVNGWAIFRDPKYWDDAETFKPERFLDNPIDFRGANFDYIPFGAGRRICPGINLAMANIEFPLANLLYHFDWKLPNGMTHEEFDMTEAFAVSVRRSENLMIVPVVYKP